MKLTEPNTKVKVKTAHLVTLMNYLQHLNEYKDEYLKPLGSKITLQIYLHNLNTLREKIAKILFNHCITVKVDNDKKHNLIFTEGERITFFYVTTYYPLPMDINFIEYEIKNGLLN